MKVACTLAFTCVVVVLAASCGGGDDGAGRVSADASTGAETSPDAAVPVVDASTPDAAPRSDASTEPDASTEGLCAEPGAVGNSMGVGDYCQTNADCSGQAAGLCTVAQEPGAPPFCTKVCFGLDTDECGEDATCEGDGALRGCVPNCILESE